MISPYNNEPSEYNLMNAWDYMQEYIDDYLDSDQEIKNTLIDFKNKKYDQDEKEDIINDIISNTAAVIDNKLEQDQMDFFKIDAIKDEVYKKLKIKFNNLI